MPAEEHFVRSEEDQIYNTPEKWYVREKWIKYAQERKEKNHRDFIRLLTLTSINCYDVEFFRDHGLLSLTDTGYAPDSVTFCEYIQERYVLIRNRLPGARGFFGKLEEFVEAGSTQLTHRAERWFPYDIINLDFTKPGFRHGKSKTSLMMDTISKILTIQGLKEQSFSLFLTFPAIKSGNDTAGIRQLNNCLRNNLRGRYPDFENTLLEKYPQAKIPSYREFLLVVAPKLVIKYGQSRNFDIQCRERCTYINRGARAVMVTFMFDCEYIGLTNGYGGENPADILARQYPHRILEIIERMHEDVNSKFAQSQRLEQRCLKYTHK
ncbi:MAG: hypothetical protein ACETWQ_22250 [Phycisphaerae bacterium]